MGESKIGVASAPPNAQSPECLAAGHMGVATKTGDNESATRGEEAQHNEIGPTEPPLSKNQQKKLKRQQKWEDQREDRKRRRKEKKQSQRARKRDAKEAKIAEAEAAGLDPREALRASVQRKTEVVPVSFIVDCDFEQYMRETELLSLSGQITRSYSCNRRAPYQAHIFISSWKGWLRTRYEKVFDGVHSRWQGCYFVEDDFVAAAKEAAGLMKNCEGRPLIEALRVDANANLDGQPNDQADSPPMPSSDTPSIVYLTSDSPHTLDYLEPYTSYVIGGIVDKNREKGICYKRATERGVRTAKLPISDFMVMASRQVLTTNQVVEIMSKWLECSNWGAAFDAIIPKRKGGRLRESASEEAGDGDEEHGIDEPLSQDDDFEDEVDTEAAPRQEAQHHEMSANTVP